MVSSLIKLSQPGVFVKVIRSPLIIKKEVQQGNWKGNRSSRYGPQLTHLFFADDLVLFVEAMQEQIMVIKRCLDRFSRA